MKVGLLQEVIGDFICWSGEIGVWKDEEQKKTFLPMKAETFFIKSY